eukprot:XP_011664582.1 PREDICTED: calcium-activated chloride channel regulator 4A-like [Strongylocentrotus purpuratus]
MFTSASQRLYNATKQQLYWSHIKILVPNTWSIQTQYQFARTETSQSANIFVHDFTDDQPYVDNFEGCGKEGTRIHMTPAYILEVQDREDKFGNTDNVLVRTWGYYRWGLFKEHYDGDEGTDPTYDSPDGSTEGTRCSLKIKGTLLKHDGTTCRSSPNQSDNPDCRFVPDTEGQTATASLLFGTRDAHIHSIEKFCDDDKLDPDSLHNPLAKNLMNKLCGGDSAWRVMKERTTDFLADVLPVSYTTPVIEVLQLSSVRSVVLVLDTSGSMAVLGSYSRGGYMLLLSDGGENVAPYIRDTFDDIENSGVIIDTITISNSADQQMENLSKNTYGISSFCTDTGIGTCLMQAFQSTITERPDVGMETVPIQIEKFCDDDESDPDSLHNPLAPNLMNKLCNYRSAWSVMRNHTDFQTDVPPVSNTTPVFEVLQLSSVRSVVLVLDISNSMKEKNRFDRMIQSSTVYIMSAIPADSKLGIVVFESASREIAELTDITDTASRQRLVNALNTSPKGTTCIGCGIKSGLKVLGSYAQGGYILLLSDGVENEDPSITDMYDDINNSGVIIDTITISNEADQQMEDLSKNTSGKSSFCSDTGIGPCLIYAFQSTITERPCVGMETVPIQVCRNFSSNSHPVYANQYVVSKKGNSFSDSY